MIINDQISIRRAIVKEMLGSVKVFTPKATDKICLIVYGNIASGKSTFSKNILQLLPGYNYVCLDRIRVDWYNNNPGMNGIARERKSEQECEESLRDSRLLLYETTASTLFYNRVRMPLIGNYDTFFINVNCPINECVKRFQNRVRSGHQQVAPPYQNKMSVVECMEDFARKQNNMISDLELDSLKMPPEKMVEKFKEFFL